MNRGVLQSSPVQQMMATGNPNWWNINTMRPPTAHHHHHLQPQHPNLSSPFLAPPNNNFFPQFLPNNNHSNNNSNNNNNNSNSSNSSSSSDSSSINASNNIPSWLYNQEQLPESWSQLLLGGLVGDEDHQKGNNMMSQFQVKKLENWEEQMLSVDHVKHELSSATGGYVYGHTEDFIQPKQGLANHNWPNNNNNNHHHHQIVANNSSSSSPKSCVTSFSSNMLDFSNKPDHHQVPRNLPVPDRSSECNSTATGGALKKARVNQSSSAQPTFKVRKEKLGDRITALHQLVSPFGKTDTASVLLEAIGYIRFLQSQIEALSLPYLGSGSGNMRQQQQSLHGERNCMFPEDPGQLLNDNCMKRKGVPGQQDCAEEPKKDLRSRGLCLVPVSCTLQVGSDNGADYWAPALGGGFQ